MTQSDRYSVRPNLNIKPVPGGWSVFDMETGRDVVSGISNSEAWREADKRNNEPKSRNESVSDWVWKQLLDDQK